MNDYHHTIAITEAGTTYTDAYALDLNVSTVNAYLNVTTITGTSPTLDVTPQCSYDGGTSWIDAENTSGTAITFTQVTAASAEQKHLSVVAPQLRFKMVAGGTVTSIAGTIDFIERA